MQEKIKYDVVLSCAGEDLPVAQSIAAALRAQNLSYYLYTEHQAEHWGDDIFKISIEKYMLEGRFVLMLISRHYIDKKWTDIERQIMQTVVSKGDVYVLPLRLDDTQIDGLSSNISYVKWQNDPQTIASLIRKKVDVTKSNEGAAAITSALSNNNFNAKTIIVNQGSIENQNIHIA